MQIDYFSEAKRILKKQMEQSRRNVDAEVWAVMTELLVDVFDEPENLLPLVFKSLSDMRHDVVQSSNTFDAGVMESIALSKIDANIKRVMRCRDFIMALRG